MNEIVVIGAGVLGASAALHLLDAGLDDIVLVDRDGEGQGTSAAGAGFIGEWAGAWDLRCGAEERAVERYGLDWYAALQDEGHDLRCKRVGNLFLAGGEKTWVERCLPALATEGAQRLSPREVAEVTGSIVDAAGIVGGVLHPQGGQISALHVARALAAAFRARGGRVSTRNPVRRLVVEGGRVRAVETERETIACERVVLAAGAWANVLLRPLGVFLPMVPLVAARVVTEPLDVPPTMPTLMVGEPSMYAREEEGGLLWGTMFAAAPRRAFVDVDPPERFDRLPLDGYEEMRRRLADSYAVVPRLARASSATVAHGAPTYTPDGRALLGEVPGVQGLYAVSGCNEGGVTHAPGFGRLIAELIADGKTRLCSIEPLRIDRFADRYRTTREVAASAAW